MEYELYHHGIKGQKWGDRRFQNEDGSLTPAGRERYGLGLEKLKGLASQARTMISGSRGSNISASTRTGMPTKKDFGVKISTPIRSTEFWSNKNDPDRQRLEKMSDAEYEQNRITGTDFYMFTRPDGSRFMVEEDLRWEIPPGMSDQAAVKMGQAEIDASREKNKKLAAIAQDVIAGKYGNGEERKKALGSQYKEVQSLVNEILWSKAKHSDSSEYELYHHGILGQKWGQRRFQYPDGAYTEEGKERRRVGDGERSESGSKKSKSTVKKVVAGAVALGTVAAAAVYVKKHPEIIAKAIAKASNISIKDVSKQAVEKGKIIVQAGLQKVAQGTKVALGQAVAGAKDGLKDAPYKVAKAAVGGAAILAANKLVEELIGKNKNQAYIKAYNAYNKKNKIGSLVNLYSVKEDEDDD